VASGLDYMCQLFVVTQLSVSHVHLFCDKVKHGSMHDYLLCPMQSLWGVDDAICVVEHWQLVQESALMSARMVVCITVEVAKKCC
jgi:ABC-type uncharacterized transport system permease subunit